MFINPKPSDSIEGKLEYSMESKRFEHFRSGFSIEYTRRLTFLIGLAPPGLPLDQADRLFRVGLQRSALRSNHDLVKRLYLDQHRMTAMHPANSGSSTEDTRR
jgi:hypothetical protein